VFILVLNHDSLNSNFPLVGYLGDLWRFRIKDRTWAWMHANGTTDLIVLHGEKGVPHPDNFIGSRDSAIGWYDSTTRELCLFSGRVFPDEAPSTCVLLIVLVLQS